MTVSSIVTVSITLARVASDGNSYPGPTPRWIMQRLKYRKSDLVLIIRLDAANAGTKDYFLLPTANLPKTRDGRTRISDRLFREFRCETFGLFMSALQQRLEGTAQRVPEEKGIASLNRRSGMPRRASTAKPGPPKKRRKSGPSRRKTGHAPR